MVNVGNYNVLRVEREVSFGVYLDDGNEGILLPGRYVPEGVKSGDEIRVFVYHDSEDRLIATTETPKAIVGEIALLKVVSVTQQGAFLDWGLMKDLFVPRSKQRTGMRVGGEYLVRLYIDERTGRVTATEKFDHTLSNEQLTVKPLEPVHLTVYRRTDIGYVVIINHLHTGVLHFSDIFRPIKHGESLRGYIKNIRENNEIDVALGTPGFKRTEEESDKILRLLKENNGYLPYHDKSSPEEVYEYFGMSKKTFKMTTGILYKQRKIELTKTGIKLVE
ncbi:MAG TPA: S1-like domain-containing RNA-binding protein [Parasegetibacter sp.]|jgi:predicted RNA-binding protein (virulence factor B family)